MKIRYLSLRQAVSVVRNTVAEGELESTLELRLLDESINDDVVEVVRCKDCRWKQGSECVRFADVRPFPDDFCSRAERR